MVMEGVATEPAGGTAAAASANDPASAAPTNGVRRWPVVGALYAALLAPGLLILLYWAVEYVQRSLTIVTFPFGFDYGEPPELDRAIAVARGHNFYGFWNVPPYHMANYTPLYPLLNGLFVRFFGVQYTSGRAIAWVCSLLVCGLLAWLAWREGKRLLAPLVTVLVWGSSVYVWDWTPLGREDDLAIVFGILGLTVVYEGVVRRRGEPPARGAVGLAAALFIAALYTRQTAVEALAASALYPLCTRPRLGVRFIVGVAAVSGVLFVALDLATGGAFSYNVIVGNVNHFEWSRLHDNLKQGWTLYQGAILLALVYIASQLAMRKQQLFILFFVAACAVAITSGKDGASYNYELPPWAAVSLFAGLGVARLHDASVWLWRRRRFGAAPLALAGVLPVAAGFLLLLQAQLSYHLSYAGSWPEAAFPLNATAPVPTALRALTATGWYHLIPGEPSPEALEQGYGYAYHSTPDARFADEQRLISEQVAETPGPVLDEDMTHLLLNGKPITIQPFELTAEATVGAWDQTPFVQAIERRQFGLIVLYHPVEQATIWQRFTPQMQQAMEANYCQSMQTADYYLYRPCQ